MRLSKPVYESLPWLYGLAGVLLIAQLSAAFRRAVSVLLLIAVCWAGRRGGDLAAAARFSGHRRGVLVATGRRHDDALRWRAIAPRLP